MTFYQRLLELMKKKNITAKQLTAELGLAKNSVTYWKNNGNIPKGETLTLLADYFEVTVEYLLGTKKEQAAHDELPASDEVKKLFEESADLSEEEARQAREFVEFLKLKRKQESS